MKTKKLLDLSEQQLVDCVANAHGCNGGALAYAFQYLQSKKQVLGSDYPYLED
jgi:hypothetical protein